MNLLNKKNEKPKTILYTDHNATKDGIDWEDEQIWRYFVIIKGGIFLFGEIYLNCYGTKLFIPEISSHYYNN